MSNKSDYLTWDDIGDLTWEDLYDFTWEDLSLTKKDLFEKIKASNMSLPPHVLETFTKLCESTVSEAEKANISLDLPPNGTCDKLKDAAATISAFYWLVDVCDRLHHNPQTAEFAHKTLSQLSAIYLEILHAVQHL